MKKPVATTKDILPAAGAMPKTVQCSRITAILLGLTKATDTETIVIAAVIHHMTSNGIHLAASGLNVDERMALSKLTEEGEFKLRKSQS